MASNKKQDKESAGVSMVSAAVAGVVGLGLGVGVAGAIALSNEKNQERLKSAFSNVKNKVVGLEGEAEVGLTEGKEKVAKTAKTVTEAKKEVKGIWQK